MDAFIEFLKLDLLLSQPQTFVYLLFCFSFLEDQPPKLIKRLIIFAIIHSVYTDIFILILPLPFHIINSIMAAIIIMFALFRDLTTKQKIYLLLFSYSVFISMDIIVGIIGIHIMGIPSHADMIRDYLFEMITIMYPQMLIIFTISWFVRKRNLLSAKGFFTYLLEGDRSTLTKLVGLILIQFFLLGALQFFQITPERDNYTLNAVLIYVMIFVTLLAFVSIIRLIIRTREQAIRVTQEVYLEDINNMFTSIRGQRHDFLNHVQVIHTMAQMGKVEQLKTYVADLVKETREVSELVHHASPALAAFIRAKMTVAVGRGISFTYELPDHWSVQESSIKTIDLIKIMGNLVDNAFDETELLPIEQRKVHTSVQLDHSFIQITVANNGRILNTVERERIFQAGYTTKGDDHSGLGLAIIMERIKHYKGELHVESIGESGTLFRLRLPQEKNFSV
jgi:signal transduction histidine kinase